MMLSAVEYISIDDVVGFLAEQYAQRSFCIDGREHGFAEVVLHKEHPCKPRAPWLRLVWEAPSPTTSSSGSMRLTPICRSIFSSSHTFVSIVRQIVGIIVGST